MTTSNQNIPENLNSCALMVRKYNLGDKAYFFSKFPGLSHAFLEIAWNFGLQKIRNNEIIKDAAAINTMEESLAIEKYKHFDKSIKSIFYYLNSEFEVKELKLTDEIIERRLRNKLAISYFQIISDETLELNKKVKSPFKNKTAGIVKKLKYGLIVIGIVGVFSAPRIIDGLTPFDTLAEKIHEKSKRKFNGAVCNDGKISHSQGWGDMFLASRGRLLLL
ncbi:MAG: hypothetical protein H7096_11610 [Flavobacterium sp.]|nr:hypothetical protein [Pedobacter sp.]